jgi:hypothetical protein
VYWAEGNWAGTQTVQRITRGGGTAELLATGGAAAIALDGSDIYVADGRGSSIWRVPKVGGPMTVLVTGSPADHPWDIAVDAVAVYWSNEQDGAVGKVAK